MHERYGIAYRSVAFLNPVEFCWGEVGRRYVAIMTSLDVLWLDVAMDNPHGVSRGERTTNLNRDLQRLRQVQSRTNSLPQSLTVNELSGDETRTPGDADFINREDVRMIQGRGRPGFLNESLQALLIRGQRFRKNLNCDRSVQLQVARQIDFAHPALTNLRADFVATKFCAGGNSHRI